MIRSRKGYRFVSEMSLSRDVLITLIRSEHGYRYVIKMSLFSTLSWSRMPWKYQESCILTQCSAKIVIRYLLDQGVSYINYEGGLVSTSLEKQCHNKWQKWKKWGKSNKGWEKWEKREKKKRKGRKKCEKWEKSKKKVLGSVSYSLLYTQVRFSMSNYNQLPGNDSISKIYQQGGTFYCCKCRNDLLLTCYD